jgi:hypothetical protein
MLSGQLGIAQVSLRRRDFTSSALDEIIHACLLRMLRALANLLLTCHRDQVSDGRRDGTPCRTKTQVGRGVRDLQ